MNIKKVRDCKSFLLSKDNFYLSDGELFDYLSKLIDEGVLTYFTFQRELVRGISDINIFLEFSCNTSIQQVNEKFPFCDFRIEKVFEKYSKSAVSYCQRIEYRFGNNYSMISKYGRNVYEK